MAAPFEKAFSIQREKEKAAEADPTSAAAGPGEIMSIHYRDDEAIYVIPAADRVTVVFSTTFQEETDKIFGRLFLQVRERTNERGSKPTAADDCSILAMIGVRRRTKTVVDPKCTTGALLESRASA